MKSLVVSSKMSATLSSSLTTERRRSEKLIRSNFIITMGLICLFLRIEHHLVGFENIGWGKTEDADNPGIGSLDGCDVVEDFTALGEHHVAWGAVHQLVHQLLRQVAALEGFHACRLLHLDDLQVSPLHLVRVAQQEV